jgi:uncharacterized NAD(P)/FAD-binding protein YdhS
VDVAIIGVGSWGLSALERLVTAARRGQTPAAGFTVHLVEPNAPGSGVYGADSPDYLLLNNPCGQLSLWAEEGGEDLARYCVGLYEWASSEGYRWDGWRCRRGPGRELTPHDYLPRRVMGEYLNWFYRTLLSEAPDGMDIAPHRTTAVGIVPTGGGRESVLLADGRALTVDHVIMTLGHTRNQARVDVGGSAVMEPYPVQRYIDGVPATATVGVAGMGLVAIDVAIALTMGRGGRFVERGNRLTYQPSGREPSLRMFSRSGLAYCAKAVSGVDQTGDYEAAICTSDFLGEVRAAGDGKVDLRAQVLPAAFAEMQLRYLSQSARLHDGAQAGREVRDSLRAAWPVERFDERVASLAARYGHFDPAQHFLGPVDARYRSAGEYQTELYDAIEADLDESLVDGGASPVKHAYEVWRINRDDLRLVTEFGGLSLASYRDFEANIRNRVNRIIAGPPVLRSQQLLALMDAGVLSMPFGPAPTLEPGLDDGIEFKSRALDTTIGERVDVVIQGHLEHPTIHRSATPLLQSLYRDRRVQQLRYGGLPVGSVELTRDFHPVSAEGTTQGHLSMFGVLTEGTRYFTHYLPSPRSRLRAVQDLGACVAGIFA